MSVISSIEEHYNAIPTLMKTGIILGGVIVSIGLLIGIWGYWRSRKRKTNRRYRAVRYSTASYITWSLKAIDSVLFVKVRASSETFGHLRTCVLNTIGLGFPVMCFVNFDLTNIVNVRMDVSGTNIILCSCMNDCKILRLYTWYCMKTIIFTKAKTKYVFPVAWQILN